MRSNSIAFSLAIGAAFTAGIVLSPLARYAVSEAHAESAPLTAMMVDLLALKHEDIPSTSFPEMHAKGLVITDNATIGVQSGNVPKHAHRHADEIQYIIEGSGTMWLGGERKEFKPGTLIVIPRGTPHAGALISSGPVKAIAIKIPPQAKDDVVLLD